MIQVLELLNKLQLMKNKYNFTVWIQTSNISSSRWEYKNSTLMIRKFKSSIGQNEKIKYGLLPGHLELPHVHSGEQHCKEQNNYMYSIVQQTQM
jgi:Fic family protein